jgi:hypothetical protein
MKMCTALFALLAVIAPLAVAQDQPMTGGSPVYKVEFNIHDGTDAAAKAGRRYTMLIDSSNKGSFKVGNRVPVSSGSGQVNYVDVGVNIDCNVQENNSGRVRLHADLDLSTILPLDKNTPAPSNPTISQLRLNVNAVVNPGKPTIVAAIDDPATMRKVDVEMTVTRSN